MSAHDLRPIGEPAAVTSPSLDTAVIASWTHRFGTCAANSRSSFAVGTTRCGVAWRADLPRDFHPAYLLGHGDRVVVVGTPDDEGRQRCVVLTHAGQRIATVLGSESAWAVDPRAGMLLGLDADQCPAAWSLRTGQPHAAMLLELAERRLSGLAVCGDLVVLATDGMRTLGGPPPDAMLDVVRIADYDDTSEFDTLRGAETVAQVVRDGDARLRFVPGRDGLAISTGAAIVWTDWSLVPHAEQPFGGVVLGLSRDSDDAVRLLAHRDAGLGVFALTPAGTRSQHSVAPAYLDAVPPILAPSGDCILAASSRVGAFKPDGTLAWEFSREAGPGALVGACSEVVFAHQDRLLHCSPAGTCTTIFRAERPLCAAPIRMGRQLYIATAQTLVALKL